MPSVASAVHAAGDVQQDGRRYVTETFVLDDGTVRSSLYLAEVGTDIDAHLTAMTAAVNDELAAEAAAGTPV